MHQENTRIDRMKHSIFYAFAMIAMSTALIACGGGDDAATSPNTASGTPTTVVTTATPSVAPQVFGGSLSDSTCALLADARVKCWGWGGNGMLGQGNNSSAKDKGDEPGEMGDALPETPLGKGLTLKTIAVGGYNMCAHFTDGRIKCWGDGRYGVNAIGNTTTIGTFINQMGDALPFVDVGTGRTVKTVSLGDDFACAVLDNNSVKCWGRNNTGQLGLGDTNNRGDSAGEMGDSLPTVHLGTGRTAKTVTTGQFHACALLDNDSVKCWGSNVAGTTTASMGDNLPAINFGAGRSVKQLASGIFHNCVLLDDNSVKCWGNHHQGQLGSGSTIGNAVAVPSSTVIPTVNLGTGRTAQWIFVTGYNSCAKLDNNEVKCWGRNSDGQLAIGNTTIANLGTQAAHMGDNLQSLQLGAGRTIMQLVGGTNHMCALLDNDQIKCWGSAGLGRLGNGSSTQHLGTNAANTGDNMPYVVLTGVGP
jgi:E3 ubiquitin-protein ligase HERC3